MFFERYFILVERNLIKNKFHQDNAKKYTVMLGWWALWLALFSGGSHVRRGSSCAGRAVQAVPAVMAAVAPSSLAGSYQLEMTNGWPLPLVSTPPPSLTRQFPSDSVFDLVLFTPDPCSSMSGDHCFNPCISR